MTGVYAQDSVFRVNSFGVTLRNTDKLVSYLQNGGVWRVEEDGVEGGAEALHPRPQLVRGVLGVEILERELCLALPLPAPPLHAVRHRGRRVGVAAQTEEAGQPHQALPHRLHRQ